MKKIFCLLLLVLLLIPLSVKADMSGPSFNYKVRVSNPEGAKTYDIQVNNSKYTYTPNGSLAYNTVVNVYDERKDGNKTYLSVSIEGQEYTLSTDDIEPMTSDVKLEDYAHEKYSKYTVFKEGMHLYSGPSSIFGKAEEDYTLPVGAEIETKYYDEVYGYIEYQGHKGWVCIYQYSGFLDDECYLMTKVDKNLTQVSQNYFDDIYTAADSVLLLDIITREKADIKIPANTKLDVRYYKSDNPHAPAYYINYQGNNYWFVDSDGSTKFKNTDNNFVMPYKDVKIMKTFNPSSVDNKLSDYTNKTIPAYTKVTYEYETCLDWGEGCFYEVTYNGTHGWIYEHDLDANEYIDVVANGTYNKKLNKDVTLYKNVNDKSESNIVKILEEGSEVTLFSMYIDENFEYEWVYVLDKDKNGIGFIEYSKDLFKDSTSKDEKPEPIEDDDDITDIENKENHEKRIKKVVNTKDSNKTRRIILISIACSLLVVAGALTALLIKNKKGKKTKVNTEEIAQEEIKNDKEN